MIENIHRYFSVDILFSSSLLLFSLINYFLNIYAFYYNFYVALADFINLKKPPTLSDVIGFTFPPIFRSTGIKPRYHFLNCIKFQRAKFALSQRDFCGIFSFHLFGSF
jgi:hypothetical protein